MHVKREAEKPQHTYIDHIRTAVLVHHIARMCDLARTMRPPSDAIKLLYDAEARLYDAMKIMGYDASSHRL